MNIDESRYVTAEIGDDVFLLDEMTGESFRMGGSAGWIWELFVQGASTETVVATIAAESGADPDEVRRDVLAFIADLVAAGIVPPDQATSPT
jgi:hypothetical protein